MEEQFEQPRIWAEKGDMAYWYDAGMSMEKPRIAATLRLEHLKRTGRVSPDTEKFLEKCRETEALADGNLASLIVNHPTWPWASGVKGAGKENYPKCVGVVEKFGRHYDVGDPMIPPYVKREPETYLIEVKGKVVEKVGIWVEGIERLETPSKLRKFLGINVDPETGEVPRRKAGHKLGFSMEGRMIHFRMGTSLLRAGGIWYHGSTEDGYSLGYLGLRKRIVERKEAQVVPTPKERTCLHCNIVVTEKKTLYCPQCGEKLTLKVEPPGFLFTGHLHLKAMREMMQDFTLCYWLVWRQACGLPITQAYNVEKLNHKPIDPWKMVDSG